MCEGCWTDVGRPTELPATAAEFAEMHAELYRHSVVGGPLHSVLDDWNLDGHIKPYPGLGPFADPDCDDEDDDTEQVYALCERISALLNAMTVPERYAALAAAEGYFG